MAGKIVHVDSCPGHRARDGVLVVPMGWQFQSMDAPMEYHMFEADPAGAVYPSQSGERGPVVYYGTDDIDADVARIRGLGGQAADKMADPARRLVRTLRGHGGEHLQPVPV